MSRYPNYDKGKISGIMLRIPLLERLSRVDFSDEEECRMIIKLTTYFVMFLLTGCLSITHIVSSNWTLLTATAIYSVLCAIYLILGHFGHIWLKITTYLFIGGHFIFEIFIIFSGTSQEVNILFTTAIVPIIVIMFFGRKNGIIYCLFQLFLLIFIIWVPLGQSIFQINPANFYMMRFPVFYVLLTLIIYFMETIRQRTILEVEKARDEAYRANRIKSEFLARMSHEIRTPINAVLGMNELILRESKSAEITRYAETIYRSGASLLSVINDILDISKIESGKIELTPSDYCLAEVISDCIAMIHPSLTEKNLKLEINADGTTPAQLYGDIVRIRQIISNIMTNAVKYTNTGTVTISVHANRTAEAQADIIIAVKDTGIGIKEEDLPTIFDTFRRIDERHTTGIEGTGLGLSISRQLVELMGGSISVKSTFGAGSEFTVIIPQKITGPNCFNVCLSVSSIKAGFEHPSPAGNYAPCFISPETHLLAVDDVAVNLEVIKGLLKKTQIQIDTASNGFDAIELIRKNRYDIVLLDDRMPGFTGTETLAVIRKETLLPKETPVIVVTANALMGEKEKYLEAGFDGYLSKPIWSFELESLLRRFIKHANIQANVPVNAQESAAYTAVGPDVPACISTSASDLLPEKIPGIDRAVAERFCGKDKTIYRELLSVFLSDQRLASLEKLYSEKNTEEYRTEIHGLKSAAKTIGAVSLSDNAQALELAAKADDWDCIRQHHDQTMQEYKTLLADIQAHLNGEKP